MEVDQRRIKPANRSNQHRIIGKALGKTLHRLEKRLKSKMHAWKGSYTMLG